MLDKGAGVKCDNETEIVKWLVLHHLLLSKTAFRYELGDPKIIKDFAEKVKTVEKLKLLLVLTVADIKGVGPEIWNDWKGSLISDLYLKCLNFLQKRTSTKNVYEFTLPSSISHALGYAFLSYLKKIFFNHLTGFQIN